MAQRVTHKRLPKGAQILKTRDDHAPVLIERFAPPEQPSKEFRVSEDAVCSWKDWQAGATGGNFDGT
jgi:hypothetical protein